MAKKIAAGNWKMNGTSASLSELETLTKSHSTCDCAIVICPPAPLLFRAADLTQGGAINIGAQDCHTDQSGAFTGDVAAHMIADTGASYVIVGHSERREAYAERNRDVRNKAEAARDAGLTAIVCLGESLEDREADNTLDIIAGQLAGSVPNGATADTVVIAYEPIWAIGTGKIPTLDQIIEVHDFMRHELCDRFGPETGNQISLLYGGSVKASNAAEIFKAKNVDGALVGGASLQASDFSPIIDALNIA